MEEIREPDDGGGRSEPVYRHAQNNQVGDNLKPDIGDHVVPGAGVAHGKPADPPAGNAVQERKHARQCQRPQTGLRKPEMLQQERPQKETRSAEAHQEGDRDPANAGEPPRVLKQDRTRQSAGQAVTGGGLFQPGFRIESEASHTRSPVEIMHRLHFLH